MKFALALAFNPLDEWIPLARAAEAASFDAVIVSDHLVYPERLATRYPYTDDGLPRWSPDTDWPDPMIATAAMAAATERLRFITSVYVLPLRHPVVAAKQIATAAVFSGDRVVLGVGAGWMREEFDLVGLPFARRGARLQESVDVMRKLWAGGMVGHKGEFFEFDPVQISPVPRAPVPIWGGGTSEVALRRAATRLDGWASEIQTRDEVREIATRLHAWRSESPLAGASFEICVALKDGFLLEHYREAASWGVTHCITVPWLLYGSPGKDVEEKCEKIARFGREVIAQPLD